MKAGKLRGGVPDISWTTEYAQLVRRPVQNCYAEIGTTWASSVVTFPTIAAHIMGQLMKFLGQDRIVFGSDSVWYGSPQWQIECAVAVPDPRGPAQEVRLPRAHRAGQAEDPGAELGPAVRDRGGGPGAYRAVPKDYEVADDRGAEGRPGGRPAEEGG